MPAILSARRLASVSAGLAIRSASRSLPPGWLAGPGTVGRLTWEMAADVVHAPTPDRGPMASNHQPDHLAKARSIKGMAAYKIRVTGSAVVLQKSLDICTKRKQVAALNLQRWAEEVAHLSRSISTYIHIYI